MRKYTSSIAVVLVKIGPKLVALMTKMLKCFKFGKVTLAAASVASYAILFTWQFALVIVGSVFFHECGHYWAMKRSGVKTRGIYLIPFFGGAAVAEESFKSRRNESFIALMGPVFGLVLAAVAFVVYLITKSPFAAAITGWMSLINIFNLLPIDPLDGGRVIKSVTFSINSKVGLAFILVGTILGAYLAIKFRIIILGVLLLIGVWETLSDYTTNLETQVQRKLVRISSGPNFEESDNDKESMPAMNLFGIIGSTAAYLGLGGIFSGLMFYTAHVPGSQAALNVLYDGPTETTTSASAAHAHNHPVFASVLAFCAFVVLIGISIFTVINLFKRLTKAVSRLKILEELEKEHEKYLAQAKSFTNPHQGIPESVLRMLNDA